MFVKICGLTNLEDTLAAVECGARAVGFNFVSTSPRYLDAGELASWIDRIPAHIWKVGVFANETAAFIEKQSRALGLDVAQLHGKETPADTPRGLRVWKAERVTEGFNPAPLKAFDVEALLLDGPASGVPFDWSVANSQTRKVILAGGLSSANVANAIARVRPWGVDVCSKIESAPGRKDHAAMRRFIETVMSC